MQNQYYIMQYAYSASAMVSTSPVKQVIIVEGTIIVTYIIEGLRPNLPGPCLNAAT